MEHTTDAVDVLLLALATLDLIVRLLRAGLFWLLTGTVYIQIDIQTRGYACLEVFLRDVVDLSHTARSVEVRRSKRKVDVIDR